MTATQTITRDQRVAGLRDAIRASGPYQDIMAAADHVIAAADRAIDRKRLNDADRARDARALDGLRGGNGERFVRTHVDPKAALRDARQSLLERRANDREQMAGMNARLRERRAERG